MLLNEQQIAEAKLRGEQVVNGFTRVRDQQARDVINLVETLELRNKQLDALLKSLKESGAKNDFFGNDTSDMKDIHDTMEELFGKNSFFGKKPRA
jgi:hypothetical protein